MQQTKRLNLDRKYVKPEQTFQQSLTKEKINEYLIGYKPVANIADVPLNTMLRYFSVYVDNKTGEQKKNFRIGGKLIKKDYPSKYVVLSNGKRSWSVQSNSSIFYYKQPTDEVIKEHQEETTQLKQKYSQRLELSEQQHNDNVQYINKSNEKDLIYLDNIHKHELQKYKNTIKNLKAEIQQKDDLIYKLSTKLKEKVKS